MLDKKYTHTFFVAEEELNDIILIPYKKEVRFLTNFPTGMKNFWKTACAGNPFIFPPMLDSAYCLKTL